MLIGVRQSSVICIATRAYNMCVLGFMPSTCHLLIVTHLNVCTRIGWFTHSPSRVADIITAQSQYKQDKSSVVVRCPRRGGGIKVVSVFLLIIFRLVPQVFYQPRQKMDGFHRFWLRTMNRIGR